MGYFVVHLPSHAQTISIFREIWAPPPRPILPAALWLSHSRLSVHSAGKQKREYCKSAENQTKTGDGPCHFPARPAIQREGMGAKMPLWCSCNPGKRNSLKEEITETNRVFPLLNRMSRSRVLFRVMAALRDAQMRFRQSLKSKGLSVKQLLVVLYCQLKYNEGVFRSIKRKSPL